VPENDPFQNAPHLVPRMAVPAGSYGPEPGLSERVKAQEIEDLLAAGDTGGVRRLLRELEHGRGAFADTDPWRLLEQLVILGMIQVRQPASAAGASPAAAASVADGAAR
jgi:hypothetical protein